MRVKPWATGTFVLLLCSGCQPAVTCPEGGVACGGDPTGTWNVVNACRDPVYAAPLPATYLGQPVEMARQPRPVMTSSDWCSSFFATSTGVKAFTFPHDALSPAGGQITCMADDGQHQGGAYQAVLNTSGSSSIELSSACLTRAGAVFTCQMVESVLRDFAAMKLADPGVPCSDSPSEPALCQFYYSYSNIGCGATLDGGCRCAYDVAFAGTFSGHWTRQGGLLTFSDISKMLPSQSDYCVSGSSMSLWGHDRTSILNQAGIRTLQLQKAP